MNDAFHNDHVTEQIEASLSGGLSDAEPGTQCHELVRHLAGN